MHSVVDISGQQAHKSARTNWGTWSANISFPAES